MYFKFLHLFNLFKAETFDLHRRWEEESNPRAHSSRHKRKIQRAGNLNLLASSHNSIWTIFLISLEPFISSHPPNFIHFLKNGQFTASFSLFPSFQYSWQQTLFNINFAMSRFELQTSGIQSDCSYQLSHNHCHQT